MTDKPKKIIDRKATLIYSAIFLLILLIYIFCAVVLPVILHEHTLVKTEAVAATCYECGTLEYWTCTDCGKVYADEKASKLTRVWKQRIDRIEHIFFDATCTEAEVCVFCEYAEGSPLGHDFEPTQYVWSKNMMECTATRVCKRDPSHIETETASSVLIDGYYTVEFESLNFGICRAYNIDENGYENLYEGEKIPTTVEDNTTYDLEKLGTITYPSSDTAQDFVSVYIDGVKYRFVGMSNGTVRIYKDDDYENFNEINHIGNHNYLDVSPCEIESLGSRVLITGYRAKLEWFACNMEKLTAEAPEYTNYCLYFLPEIIGNDATPFVDFENNIVYWYGYTTHYSDTSEENKIIITSWDISELNFSDPNITQVNLLSKSTVDNFGVIQGGKCFNGDVYFGVSNSEQPYESKMLRLKAATGTVKTKLMLEDINVMQGISYIIEGNDITWLVSDYYDLYKIKIER